MSGSVFCPSCQGLCRFVGLVFVVLGGIAFADDFPDPVNTQAPGEHPPAPREMLDLFELPDGFHVSLFAGEPDVRQPIAFDFDDHGRMWVAENYSYGAHGKYDPDLRDRVIILHDNDGDGEHDERKVFWDKGWMLTGLTWGYGGLWVLHDGTLSFIPDKDGDDVPDGEPVEMLNGWTKGAGHNFVSGLVWGPDGWLYGRHGITDTSLPGTPDTPKEERRPFNCGIWRFHPLRHTFEVVCNGTTNPWGLDYNEYGDMFMSNNVIGHFWHVIPGAHFERMFGQDFNPYLFELMPQCADHYHWDNTGKWNESRDGKANHLGGGHSHCGLMIYQGRNFPPEYRGKAFMCNTHGRCVNVDRIERSGSSYVARHEDNFLTVKTPWFRGVDIKSGPAGCVYLSDWSDNGECHDHDGVHRTSGRIYRISYGQRVVTPPAVLQHDNLTTLAVKAISSGDVAGWESRHARRLLIERFPTGPKDKKAEIRQLCDGYWTNDEAARVAGLQTFTLLLALDALEPGHIHRAIIAPNEQIRRRAIEYAVADPKILREVRDLLDSWVFNYEESPVVLLAYAGAIQRYHEQTPGAAMPEFPSLSNLVKLTRLCGEDNQLQLMTWYALERVNHSSGDRVLPLSFIHDAKVRKFHARWLAANWDQHQDQVMNAIMAGPLKNEKDLPEKFRLKDPIADTRQMLQGLIDGLQGQIVEAPEIDWESVREGYASTGDVEITNLVSELSALFGSEQALVRLRDILKDRNGSHSSRSKAVFALARRKDDAALPIMLSLLNDRAVYADIAAALANYDDPRIPTELLKRWDNLRHGSREAATDTLCSRRSYGVELVKALDDGRVQSGQLTASHVRQLLGFNEPFVTEVIESKWGVVNDSTEAKAAAMQKWQDFLTEDVLADASLQNGAALFRKSCATCHRLYGEGGRIGPDLTGSNRGNMDYLLGNIIDPGAVVPKQFTMTNLLLKSGRLLNGVIVAETDTTITVQTDKEQKVISASDVDERVHTTKSLMPDGLLDSLKEAEVRDLIAFLRQRR